VWEDDRFIGAVMFARGASPHLGTKYGLTQTEVCELVRVALTKHESQVTRIVAIALRLLKKSNPGIKLVVSFADPAQGHHGGIYQGGGWIYTGQSNPMPQYFHEGRWKHCREVASGAFGKGGAIKGYKDLPQKLCPGKYRYLMPLDDSIKSKVSQLAKPYPKCV
jgi:hypothetical protein